jgi:hypothetical protein
MNGKTPYRIKAESVEACNCRHGCNCQFEGVPNEGKCEFVIAYDIREGRVGDTVMDGVRAVVAAKYPGAIHEGRGHVVLFVDENTSSAQVDALVSVLSGKLGGMPWEALAGTIARLEGPVRKPIQIKVAGEHSEIHIADAVEVKCVPLQDPVSGAEKEVHITYPKGGFFWNDARVAITAEMRAEYGDLRFAWPRRYAAAAEVNWTNQR